MESIRPDLLLTEFLDCLQERAEKHFKGHLHQAFIDWYVEAEFGHLKWDFTDGPKDGGIDAVIWRRPEDKPSVIILQSKFSEKIEKQHLNSSAYKDFQRVIEAFHSRHEAFDEFMERVAPEIRKLYLKAFKLIDGNWLTEKKAFRLVTTSKRTPSCETKLIPAQNFIYGADILKLYRQYRRVLTPKARELTMTIDEKLAYKDPKRGVTSFLFNAKVSDFKRYLDNNDAGRLVARNIRYQVPGPVGAGIRRTYEDVPHDFWYRHNGITIVCDGYAEKNRKATLTNPSVINGAQTLYAISRSRIEKSPALVGTRVIIRGADADERPENDEWLQKIIRGVNTQNRVHNYDFRSNEPEQFLLQTTFRDLGVFYERKRGEWNEYRTEPKYKGFKRLSLARLGQILMVVSEENGEGVIMAKRGVDAIFNDRHYSKLFPSRPAIANRFRDMYIAFRLFELLRRFGYARATDYKRQRHGFLNSLWILYRGIVLNNAGNRTIDNVALKRALDLLEKQPSTKRIIRTVTRQVWGAWRIGRKKDPELWTPNNFFKSKYGNQRILALAFPKVRKDLNSLGRDLFKAS